MGQLHCIHDFQLIHTRGTLTNGYLTQQHLFCLTFLKKHASNDFVADCTVRAEIITEPIPEKAGPVMSKTFLLELMAFRLIPVICSARRAKPENYRTRKLSQEGPIPQ